MIWGVKMRRSTFIHSLVGTGTALIATALYAGLASADTAAPALQPSQTSPVISTTTNDKVITSDTVSSSTVVSKSDTTVIAPGASNQAGDGSAGTSAPVVAATKSDATAPVTNDQSTPVIPTDSTTSLGVSNVGSVTPGSEILTPATRLDLVSPPALASIIPKYVPARMLAAGRQAFSEQGNSPSLVMTAPVARDQAPNPGQPAPAKSTGILTQLGELLRHLFAPLVAGVSGMAAVQSGSSWPLANFYVLIVISLAGFGFASYLSLLRRSGYRHGARSDEDGRQPVTPLLMGFSAVALRDTLSSPFLVGFVQNPDSFKCSITPTRKEVKT